MLWIAFWAWFCAVQCGGAALVLHRRAKDFLRTATRAEAIVTNVVRRGSRGTCPEFTFTDGEGNRHAVTSRVTSYPPRFAVGDAVTVPYPPGRPDRADELGFFAVWGLTSAFAVVALGVLALGVVAFQAWRMQGAGE